MAFCILTDSLPTSVSVAGKEYPVRTDFRRWILFLSLLDEIAGEQSPLAILTAARVAEQILLVSPADRCDTTPSPLSFLGAFLVFARGGLSSGSSNEDGEPVFSFTEDAEVIFASFWETYGMDLSAVSLHWWKFLALLRSLPADCNFMKLVALRLCDTTQIEDDGLRREMRRAKAAVRLRRPVGEGDSFFSRR